MADNALRAGCVSPCGSWGGGQASKRMPDAARAQQAATPMKVRCHAKKTMRNVGVDVDGFTCGGTSYDERSDDVDD